MKLFSSNFVIGLTNSHTRYEHTSIKGIDDYCNILCRYDLHIERRLKKANRYSLVVAAECTDTESADTICRMLEANGIKAMVVEKNSTIYIKDSSLMAPVQVQVCGVDLEKAVKLINE